MRILCAVLLFCVLVLPRPEQENPGSRSLVSFTYCSVFSTWNDDWHLRGAHLGLGCGSVGERLPSVCKALGSIPSSAKNKRGGVHLNIRP